MLQFIFSIILIILTAALIIFLGFALIFAFAGTLITAAELAKTPLFWAVVGAIIAVVTVLITALTVTCAILRKRRKEHGSDR